MDQRVIDGEVYVKASDIIEYLLHDAERVRQVYGLPEAMALQSVANAMWFLCQPGKTE